jgi:hypothetical protein
MIDVNVRYRMVERIEGRVMDVKILNFPAPSTIAASYIEVSMDVIPAITMIRVYPNHIHH